MLDEYRIEPLSVGQYLDRVYDEDIKIDQAVQRSFCWTKEIMNALIYSALSRKIYIPNLILAEENMSNGTKQTYVVDGGQRTEALYQFKYCNYKITNNLRTYIIPYKKKLRDDSGNILRDEYENILYELIEYDIRNKTYEDLPDELKSRFNGCPLTTVIYQDCTTEETSELVLLYNNYIGMNVSQKSLTYIGKYADEIKRIKKSNRFLMDCTVLSENEKKKGIWERVIAESVMGVNHFDNWKKSPKDMCDFLNNNSSLEEYKNIENLFNRLIPYSDKLENSAVAGLFNSKNLFIWIMLFDKFTKLSVPDEKFGEFMKDFSEKLKYKEIDGETWEIIDGDRHTKDKSLINRKMKYLEYIMTEYLKSQDINSGDNDESFIAKNVNIDIKEIHNDMEFYSESLDDLTDKTINDDSKLLDRQNRLSLLAMVAYSYQQDVDLEDWLTVYAKNNNTYIHDQKENFLHMKEDFKKFNTYGNEKSV